MAHHHCPSCDHCVSAHTHPFMDSASIIGCHMCNSGMCDAQGDDRELLLRMLYILSLRAITTEVGL